MTPQQAQGAVGVVGSVAALGLLLPSIDRTWNTDGSREEHRVRSGEALYLGAAAAITLLASYGQGSMAPFVLGFGLALLIVGYQEYALRQPAKD